MTDETFTLVQEHNPQQDHVQLVKEDIASALESKRRLLAETLTPVDKETQEIADSIKKWLELRLVGRFGIAEENINWPEKIYFFDSKQRQDLLSKAPDLSLGSSHGVYIVGLGVAIDREYFDRFEDKDLRKFALARILAEEI